MVRLTTEESRNGHHLHLSIEQLFRLVRHGFHAEADRNVFGVDLNPIALELAEVSLWLNGIHQDGHVPWFGYQLMFRLGRPPSPAPVSFASNANACRRCVGDRSEASSNDRRSALPSTATTSPSASSRLSVW